MRRFPLTLFLIPAVATITSMPLQGQNIRYESSFEKAKTMAAQQKKPLAVLITIQPPVPTPNYLRGLNDKKVIETFNSSFINFKTDRADTASSAGIIRQYKIYRFPSFVFLDHKGGLMFSDIAVLSIPQLLLETAGRAVSASKEKSLADFDSIYKAGNNSTVFLKEYISRREKSGISDNAELIEKYTDGLNISDLKNYTEVLFILKAGPYYDGVAYKLASTHRYLIDSIYKTEPLADRIVMNNAIISNTLNNAIATKTLSRALAAANFTQSTWSKDRKEGQKNWYLRMLQYYSGVKDTTNYLKNAVTYFEQYYMSITVDSIRKKDSADFVTAKNKAKENAIVRLNDSTVRRSVNFSYAKDKYATDLNNAAWSFYQMAGDNNEKLLKAMLWSRRAIELSPKPAFYDTYAHLLYKLKFYDEAVSMQKKALESAKAEKTDTKLIETEYEKIKNRTL